MKILIKTLVAVCLNTMMYLPICTHAESTAIELKENQFVTLTFHDVRDDIAKSGDRDVYAISTKNLGQYLAWMKKEGWTAIRLEDVWQARQKQYSLPEKAVLLSFDDGALSSYSRVFPLLKQFNVPAVFAIPTSWINGNTKDAYEAYGAGNLMNWNQMREMQASGLVEFVSHSDNMHHGVLANPQMNMQPAAITRIYSPATRNYESDKAYAARVIADLKKSKQILDQELNINTRAIFWPYGAVTPEAEALARTAGLPMSFSLGSISSLADSVKTYQRALVMLNPTPEILREEKIDFLTYARSPNRMKKTFLRLDLNELVTPSYSESDQKLGQLLDQINAFKSNVLVLRTVADLDGDGKIDVSYFPNRQLKMQQDLLNRTVWQARTRSAHKVYAELPLTLETEQKYDLAELTGDLVKNNSSIEGLMIETGQTLRCAIDQAIWSEICKTNLQTILNIKNRTKNKASYYANISHNYQTALKINVGDSKLLGLKSLIGRIPDHADFLYLTVDPVKDPHSFKALLTAIQSLSVEEREHLIVSLPVDTSIKSWNIYQQAYAQLKAHSIQKLAINNYQFSNAKAVHQQLYKTLSLNDSPLTYRDPFVQITQEKR